MSEPIDRQSATSAEKTEHDNARFTHWEEEQARENEAQSRKTKIIAGFIATGAIVWAWMAFRL
jgi:aspartokinase